MTQQRAQPGSRQDWERVAAAFDALAEASVAERRERLEALRASDPALAEELGSLLTSLEEQPEFLSRPAIDLEAAAGTAPRGPERIGPYRILERLGRGGMGTVYRARRDDGPLDQVVAIKVVRPAAGDPQRLERFAQEARLLSRLDHPGIARPLDAGTLDDDSAYLVMEYVDGVRVDRYCRERGLGVEERVHLLLRICEAVQFAHRNLVVHRDLKPANVLVDAAGDPRLLDFGIARMLDAGEDPHLTLTGQLTLTPQYAAPEQFTGDAVTTASDVYALGVLAYELLAGRPPLALEGLSLPEMIDTVCNRTPAAPSEAAGDPSLRGDLDAIVLVALRKEPDRRYASAGELAGDLRRHLRGEAVQAHADTLGYRMGKFLRRHRLAVGAGAVFVLALTVLSAVATLQAMRAGEARDRAELEARRATEVLGFFQRMLSSADPAQAQGAELSVRDLLDQTAGGLDAAALDPLALATVQETVASTYLSLGLPDAGLPLAEAAASLLAAELGPEHPRTLAARHAEARFHLYQARFDRAIEILEPTFEARRRVLGDTMDTMSTLHNLSYAYAGRGEIDRALELDLVQLEIVEELSGPDSPEALTTLISVGHGYYSLGRTEAARDVFKRVYEGQRRHLGDRHPTTLSALNNYAVTSRQLGDMATAESLLLELVAARREVLGERHAQSLNALHNLGELYLIDGRPQDAAPLLEEALQGRREALGPAHPDVIDSLVALSRLHLAQRRREQAAAAAAEALELAERSDGLDAAYADKAREALAAARGGPPGAR